MGSQQPQLKVRNHKQSSLSQLNNYGRAKSKFYICRSNHETNYRHVLCRAMIFKYIKASQQISRMLLSIEIFNPYFSNSFLENKRVIINKIYKLSNSQSAWHNTMLNYVISPNISSMTCPKSQIEGQRICTCAHTMAKRACLERIYGLARDWVTHKTIVPT